MATLNDLIESLIDSSNTQAQQGGVTKFRENEDSAEFQDISDVAKAFDVLAKPAVQGLITGAAGSCSVQRKSLV